MRSFRKPASPQMKITVEFLRLFGVLNVITGVCILVMTAENLSGGSFLLVGLLMLAVQGILKSRADSNR
jgi:hypothetical protein